MPGESGLRSDCDWTATIEVTVDTPASSTSGGLMVGAGGLNLPRFQ